MSRGVQAISLNSERQQQRRRDRHQIRRSWYGDNWDELSRKTKERDGYTCRRCGWNRRTAEPGDDRHLEAHHIIPLPRGRNVLANLKTLCSKCHPRSHSFRLHRRSRASRHIQRRANNANTKPQFKQRPRKVRPWLQTGRPW